MTMTTKVHHSFTKTSPKKVAPFDNKTTYKRTQIEPYLISSISESFKAPTFLGSAKHPSPIIIEKDFHKTKKTNKDSYLV